MDALQITDVFKVFNQRKEDNIIVGVDLYLLKHTFLATEHLY